MSTVVKSLRFAVANLAIQFPLRELHIHAVARRDDAGVSNHASAVFVPAHGIPAPEHGEWAERLEPGHGLLQLRPPAILAPARHSREPSFGRDEASPDARQSPSDVLGPELSLDLVQTTSAARDALASQPRQRVRQFRGVPPAHREASGETGECRPAADDVDAATHPLDPRVHRPA